MPTQAEQDGNGAARGVPLTVQELGRLMTVFQDQSFSETRSLAVGALTLKADDGTTRLPDAEQALLQQTRADLEYFFDGLPDGTIRSGEDYDAVRDKEEVRERVRLRAGLPALSAVAIEARTRLKRASQSVQSTRSVP